MLKVKLIVPKRKARQKTIVGTHSKKQWQKLLSFFNGICPKCNRKKKLTKDHIIPFTWKSSTNYINNLQPLCNICNIKKSNRSKKDYRPPEVKLWADKEVENWLNTR